MVKIIDGKAMAEELREKVKAAVSKLPKKPALAVILVGDDPASHVYVSNKIKACQDVGINSLETRFPKDVAYETVANEIQRLNNDKGVDGILLQLPLPSHLDSDSLVQMISPAKDVDGLTLQNVGALVAGTKGLIPCTPQGSLLLIEKAMMNLEGRHAIVIGRSLLFGKPMAQLLLGKNCTVTMAHSKTRHLEELCQMADIVVAAVGRPKMVKASWIKPGACVIDVGINRTEDGKLCGDVDYDEVKEVAGFITPVPGGVGPMTISCLLLNTLLAHKNKYN